MIRRNSEPGSPTWNKWKLSAKNATDDLVASFKSGEELKFSSVIYKAERVAILHNFFDKCAYCESLITATQHMGDVEHYRPKARVKNADGSEALVGGVPHPGYYWLAYDWRNLLPACEACNRPGTSPQQRKSGKFDFFPVRGDHCVVPGELSKEEPLLLNPLIQDNPKDHLIFDPETGIVAAKDGSPRGQATIDILGLNRDGLVDSRREAAQTARLHAGVAMKELLDTIIALDTKKQDVHTAKLNSVIKRYTQGERPYTAVCRTTISSFLNGVFGGTNALGNTIRNRWPQLDL